MKNKIYPVIHTIDENQVRLNIETVLACGLNQVMFVNHQIDSLELDKIINKMVKEYPKLWIGANFLDLSTTDALAFSTKVNGLWVDSPFVHPIYAEESYDVDLIKHMSSNLELFGSFAFKYQKQPREFDYKNQIEKTEKFCDAIVTSGSGTGSAPNLRKIELIKSFATKPIGIASGVDKSNIKSFSKFADFFFVATSITHIQTELIIKDELKKLIDSL
jgi:hypothetical protein